MNWLSANYKWLFDGVAGAATLGILAFVLRWVFSFKPSTPTQSVNSSATLNASPHIEQHVYIGGGPQASPQAMAPAAAAAPISTSRPTHEPPAVDKTNWPDVLLQCEWPQLFGKPSEVPLMPGVSNWMVRKRPWTLRHPGGGVVYNVKIHDIRFGRYGAAFDAIDALTDKPESVLPIIYKKPPMEVVITHDLESLMAHPPDDCDMSKYAKPSEFDRLTADVPVFATYNDKNGVRYGVKYALHYDFWLEEGRIIRVGGIEKL